MYYLRERGVLCVGIGCHFCNPVLINMSNITFQVLGLSTFVFNKCSEIIIFTIIFVVKSLKGFGWNNCPASQTVAQHYISIGQFIVLSGVFGAGILKVTSIMQSEKTVQSHNAASMTGQHRRLWVNIDWLSDTCLRKVYNRKYTTDPVID